MSTYKPRDLEVQEVPKAILKVNKDILLPKKQYMEVMEQIKAGDYQSAIGKIYEHITETNRPSPIRGPEDVAYRLAKYASKKQEYFIVITLDGYHQVIREYVATIGLVNRCMVHPREIFSLGISDKAAGIIVGHCHPSGMPAASPEDKDVHSRLTEAGEIIGIPLLDSIVVAVDKATMRLAYTSMQEGGNVPNYLTIQDLGKKAMKKEKVEEKDRGVER